MKDIFAIIAGKKNATSNEIREAIESVGAIAYTARSAREEADRAIAALSVIEDSPYKEALIALANYSVERSF